MSYSVWSNFAYYNVGDIVSYESINYSAVSPNVDRIPPVSLEWIVLPAPSGAGVSSLVAGTGALTMSVLSGAVNLVGNDIQLSIAYPTAVDSLNSLTGAVLITSNDSSVGITPAGQEIDLSVVKVESLAGGVGAVPQTGAITLTSTDGSVAFTPAGQDIDLSVVKVESLNSLTGVLTLTSPDGSIGISSPDSSTIALVGTPTQYPIILPTTAYSFSNVVTATNPFTVLNTWTIPYTDWYGGKAVITFYCVSVATMTTTGGNDLLSYYCSINSPSFPATTATSFYIDNQNKQTGCNAVFICPISAPLAAGSGSIVIELRGQSATNDTYNINFIASYATLSRSA